MDGNTVPVKRRNSDTISDQTHFPWTSVRISIAASLCSMAFGYDVGVISGSLSDMSNTLHLSTFQREVATSGLNFVAGFGGLVVSGILLDRIGRRKTLLCAAILLLVGATLVALAHSFAVLVAGRAFQGLGSGVAIVSTSVYITEISPASKRGMLVAVADISINFGILVGYIADYVVKYTMKDSPNISWRIAMGGAGVMPLLFCIFYGMIPETPQYRMLQGNASDSSLVVRQITPGSVKWNNSTHHLESFGEVLTLPAASEEKSWSDTLCCANSKDRTLVWTAIFIGMSQQFTGTEAILYYTPSIFNHLSATTQFLANLGVGGCKFMGEVISAGLAERVGRRSLMIGGNFVLCICVFGFGTNVYFSGADGRATTSIILLSMIMFAFSIGAGPMTLVVVNEMLPLNLRAKTVSVCATYVSPLAYYLLKLGILRQMAVFMNRMVSGTVALTFLTLKNAIGVSNVFFLYGGIGMVATFAYLFCLTDFTGVALTTKNEDEQPSINNEQQPLLSSTENPAH